MEEFSRSSQEVVSSLGSDEKNGLSDTQVLENAEKYGKNEFTKTKSKSVWRRIFEALTEPMLVLLLVAWAITVAVNIVRAVQGEGFDFYECIGILVAVCLSVTLTVVMEGKSAKAFEELNKIKEGLEIKVIRGGVAQYVPQNQIVVGDIVCLETGNKIAADGRLIESVSLMCDESSLTGESAPVEKDAEVVLSSETPVAERRNCVFSGCFVTAGSGKMVVTGVGDNTQFGLIAREIQRGGAGATPVQVKLAKLGKYITIIGAIAAILVFAAQLGFAAFNKQLSFESVSGIFISSIVLLVAAVPEGLPTTVAISLSINVARMAKESALVKKMVACETIGCVNVICSDKTGTLTENKMTVTDAFAGGAAADCTSFSHNRMIQNFCLNSTADVNGEQFVGNPTECALLVFAQKNGIDYRTVREGAEIAEVYPFSSDLKNMTTVVKEGEGYAVYTKGSPEKILSLCDISAAEKAKAEQAIIALQKRARRVIAFAHKMTNTCPEDRQNAERGVHFDGFVGIADPLRKEVFDAVASAHGAGIELKMLTGDNIVTATAIAEELGILDEKHVAVEAGYLEKLSDAEFSAILPSVRVIARSTPVLKMRVVKELQAQGNVVAVTGDGINDAPALKNADVGIAMGISGTEVSKEAADIVLLNDSFSTIVNSVKWGRGIYENFKRFIRFQLTVNAASVLLVCLCVIAGLFDSRFHTPFTALDLLWINVIMDGPPALTLGMEPVSDDLMKRKPTGKNESIVSKEMLSHIVVCALFMCVICFAQQGWDILGVGAEKSDTAVFTLFVLFQLFNAFNCREPGYDTIFRNLFGNKLMLLSFVATLVLQIVIICFGGKVFHTVPLDIVSWLKVGAMALSIIALDEIFRLIVRIVKKNRGKKLSVSVDKMG